MQGRAAIEGTLGLCHVFSTFNYVFWNAFDLYLFCIHIFLVYRSLSPPLLST